MSYSKYLISILILLFFADNHILVCEDKSSDGTVAIGGSIIKDACESDACDGFAEALFEVFDNMGKLVYKGKSKAEEFGYYYIKGLLPGIEYKLVINDSNYLKRIYTVNLPVTDKYSEYSKDFLVVPKKKELGILLRVPPFELRKTKIRVGSAQFLDDIEAIIKENPNVQFEIRCYPDNDENEEKNLQLTSSRCKTLKDYFNSRGIESGRLYIHPNPYTDPKLPPPPNKNAKGKRYIGSSYLVIVDF